MEEKKTIKRPAQEKLSYEKLKEIVAGLSQRNQTLERQLQNFDTTSFMLSMLFHVMDNADRYDKEFVEWTKTNIQTALVTFMDQISQGEEKVDENE